ncbi:hypothetical protein [Haematomicrobium sanguinis]|uniref:hypothetical protein n=1 Tax=Haematomicrobium sanguinis TaxID=479106 RepID=UPI0004789C13|nr:hypothetical protein [Haematomicrobium sanguinis]
MSATFSITKITTARAHHTLLVTSAAFASVIILGSLTARIPGAVTISWISIVVAALLTAAVSAGLSLLAHRYFPAPPSEREELYARHLAAFTAWSQHELDPDLALARPHMIDVRVPETARLVRALRSAERAASGSLDDYRVAVSELESALSGALNVSPTPVLEKPPASLK